MKKIIIWVSAILISGVGSAQQVGMGTDTPHLSSMLEVSSTTKGFLPPRMTTGQRDTMGVVAEGMVIYNTDDNCIQFFNGTVWVNYCDLLETEMITFQGRYGGNAIDIGNSVIQTADGGYIIIGESQSNMSGDVSDTSNGGSDYWFIKLDKYGVKVWDRLYGGPASEIAFSINPTSDGGFIVVGNCQSNASGDVSGVSHGVTDYWILKLDATGNIVWQKLYGGNNHDYGRYGQQTSDGGYIIAGFIDKSSSGNISGTGRGEMDYWLLKLDAAGNIVWDKLYGGTGFDRTLVIKQTPDGGYITIGYATSSANGDVSGVNHGSNDFWVVKLDAMGNKQWDKLYGGTGNDIPFDFKVTADGGYIAVGQSTSATGDVTDTGKGGTDYWILKLDSAGNKIWNKLYGGSGTDIARSVSQTSDGGYIVAGESTSSATGNVSDTSNGLRDYWIIKLDANGNLQWNKLYGGNGHDVARSVSQTTDGGYIVTGDSELTSAGNGDQTGVPGKGSNDYWVLKLDADGNL